MQSMPMNTARQLVTDRHAALGATARHGRLRRLFARADDSETETLDIAALERAAEPTPTAAVAARAVGAGRNDEPRVNKVA